MHDVKIVLVSHNGVLRMTQQRTTIQTGLRKMPATFVADSINTEKRTIDVVFATQREVLMHNWREGGYVREVLVCTPEAGDLTRLNNGGPLCDSHRTYSVKDALGVVEKAWFEGGKGRATIRFSKRADVEPVWQDVQDGIVKGISVGYRVYTYEKTESAKELPLFRAIKWEGHEISLALVQADMDSKVGRSNEPDNFATTILNIDTMKQNNNAGADGAPGTEPNTGAEGQRQAPGQQPAPVVVPVAAEAQQATNLTERTRALEITKAVRKMNLPAEYAEELIGQEITLDQARGMIIDKVAAANATTASNNVQTGVRVNADETDKFREAAIIGLCLRSAKMNESQFTAEQVSAGREFRGKRLMQLAIDSLVRGGENYNTITRMTDNEIIKRAITSSSSDFPVLLEGTARRVLLAAYAIIPDTWRQWCSVGTVSDFRAHKRLRMGGLSRLDTLTENGNLKTKALSDATAESVSATTKGNIINLSRVMIINDDLDGFTRLPNDLGRAAARGIEIDAYALLASNPTLTDGVALFHATHANLATGAAMSVAAFDDLRIKMAQQKDPNNQDFIGLRPSTLLCGIAYGGTAKVINGAQYDPDTANKLQRPNMVNGLFRNIVDTPQISTTKYYAFANPMDEPVIEVSFLNGVQTPYLESEESFDQLGLRWRIYHDYGVGAVGFRGAVYNPGA